MAVNDWKPKFNVDDCIKWGDYDNLCIKSITYSKNEYGGEYNFKPAGSKDWESIEKGWEPNDGYERPGMAPAILIKKGGKSNRRKSTRRKSSRRKSTRRKSSRTR